MKLEFTITAGTKIHYDDLCYLERFIRGVEICAEIAVPSFISLSVYIYANIGYYKPTVAKKFKALFGFDITVAEQLGYGLSLYSLGTFTLGDLVLLWVKAYEKFVS